MLERLRVTSVLLVALLALAGCRPAADEFSVREKVYGDAAEAFRRGEFDALDEMLGAQFGKKLRTPSGIWQGGVALTGVYETMRGEEFGAMGSKAAAWMQQRPQSPYAPLALASFYRRQGCRPCGQGGEEGDRRRRRGAWEHALRVLESNRQRSSRVPEWHNLRLQLATSLQYPDERMQQLYAEAVQAEPAYFPTRFAWVSYLARSGDKAGIRVEAAARAVLQEAPSPDRDAMYARMLWWAVQDRDWDALIRWPGVNGFMLDKSFEALLSRYPEDWNRNNYARFMCLAGRHATARRLMHEHVAVPRAWNSEDEFRACIMDAIAPD